MASALFDPHAFVKKLTEAGMPEPQAEILADEQMRLINERVATKGDIASLEAAMTALQKRLTDRLAIRLGGMIAVAVVILTGLVKLL
jgi:hypothetical protein